MRRIAATGFGRTAWTAIITVAALSTLATGARAEIDGHGPDAWRVTGVAGNDVLNVRTGPGTQYEVSGSFAPNERGLQQITCVPLITLARFSSLTPDQVRALPPRWCLMRNSAMTTAGWVAQRFITPDHGVAAQPPKASATPRANSATPASTGDPAVTAVSLVRKLYDAHARADQGQGPDPLSGRNASDYFTTEILALLRSGQVGAHPLYGAQDFDGRVTRVAADPEQPVLRGMVTVRVDFINFGQPQRASYFLRADTTQPGSPLRIFRVEHDGWSFP